MNLGKAIVKFILGGAAGFLVFALGYGCLMACNSYSQPTSDGLGFFLWAIFVLVGGFAFAGDDISAAKRDIDRAKERRIQEEQARAEENQRREQEEADRRERERISELTNQTKKKIAEHRGYELNILPFLTCLGEAVQDDKEFLEVMQTCTERANTLKNLANELNRTSQQYHMGETLQIHVK